MKNPLKKYEKYDTNIPHLNNSNNGKKAFQDTKHISTTSSGSGTPLKNQKLECHRPNERDNIE